MLLERIAEDPILRDAKLIAEAWDAAGAYQVGQFSQRRWAEWNGVFRDDVRRFWRGDEGMVGRFATRLAGSSDLYSRSGKGPSCSINFVTCHDGFTLNDLVSYAAKHNEANGEQNRDGAGENHSENYGVEGESSDPDVEAVRTRQVKNILLTLAVSRGIPMLLAGDEFRRTQHGNSNGYCQDNDISWVDWSLRDRHDDIVLFARSLLTFRRAHPVLSREAFYSTTEIDWFDPEGRVPDWSDGTRKCLACLVHDVPDLYLMFNAACESVSFALPPRDARPWRVAVDTSQPPPLDRFVPGRDHAVPDLAHYTLAPRSSVILVG